MVPNKITPNFSSAFILIWFQWILNVIPWYWSPYLLIKASTLIKYDHAICGINHLKWFSDPLEWHPLANNFCHTTALTYDFLFQEKIMFCSQDIYICVCDESSNFRVCEVIIDIIAFWTLQFRLLFYNTE